jgi:uncharacterized membrane protein YedE/YeeE
VNHWPFALGGAALASVAVLHWFLTGRMLAVSGRFTSLVDRARHGASEGVLVGFGTRMASGCTSGHGLCGVSRLQPGSLLATAAFFGAGIVVSFLLGALS